MKVAVDIVGLSREISVLALFSEVPAPAVTRIVFSPVDLEARLYIKKLCRDAGLAVREDAVGNTFARWQGTDPTISAVGTGSHIDAIPHAGAYDGTVGVLGGLEAIRSLQRSGFQPRRSIELLIFTSEEPTRFGLGCLGSRMLSRSLSEQKLATLRDSDGNSVDAVRQAAGFQGPLDSIGLDAGYYAAFIELHIEQGPLLEARQIPIGVVTHIAAPATLRVTIEGAGGHAGAVLMPDRRDAFLGAAEVALVVERAAKTSGAIDTVATVGVCNIFPGAVNSVPSRARIDIDVRDIDLKRRDAVVRSIGIACNEVSARRKVAIETEVLNADPPASSDSAIVEAIESACREQGLESMRMISRAYHDSLFLSRVVPIGMIFIPCRNGVSHHPDELAEPEAIERGVAVLARTLARLAK